MPTFLPFSSLISLIGLSGFTMIDQCGCRSQMYGNIRSMSGFLAARLRNAGGETAVVSTCPASSAWMLWLTPDRLTISIATPSSW